VYWYRNCGDRCICPLRRRSGVQRAAAKKNGELSGRQAEADADASQRPVWRPTVSVKPDVNRLLLRMPLWPHPASRPEKAQLRITSGITEDSEQDAYQTILNGANSASRLQAQAQADRITGSNAATAGNISAGSSLWLPAGLHMMAGKRLKRAVMDCTRGPK
jgi:hypothetical protein